MSWFRDAIVRPKLYQNSNCLQSRTPIGVFQHACADKLSGLRLGKSREPGTNLRIVRLVRCLRRPSLTLGLRSDQPASRALRTAQCEHARRQAASEHSGDSAMRTRWTQAACLGMCNALSVSPASGDWLVRASPSRDRVIWHEFATPRTLCGGRTGPLRTAFGPLRTACSPAASPGLGREC